MYHIVTLATVFFLLAPTAFTQTTRYVATTGEDTTDCATEANPCATITYAIDQADDFDVIEIADGEYTESFEITKSLNLHGESEAGTIIQAHEQPDQANSRVITIDTTGIGLLAVAITNLTIRHGNAISDDIPNNRGGGIYNDGAVLSLTDVTVSDNAANFGGGMFNVNSFHVLTNVTFSGNIASVGGGGIYNWRNNVTTIDSTTFSGNVASNGGGMENQGRGVSGECTSSVTLSNVIFDGNTAEAEGGGIFQVCPITLTNAVFSGNVTRMEDSGGAAGMFLSDEDGDGTMLANVIFVGNSTFGLGGGVRILGSSPALSNVAFIANEAQWGGGIVNDRASPTLTNVTFVGNSASETGGGMWNRTDTGSSTPSLPTLANVIMWDNQAGDSTTSTSASIFNVPHEVASEPTISYSLVANSGGSADWDPAIGTDGGNNIDADPLFVDGEGGDLHLMEGSPAIDTGDPDTDPLIFPTNEDGDPIDLEGNLRFFGDLIDMGAYEWRPNVAGETDLETLAGVLGLPRPNPTVGTATFTVAVERGQDVSVEVFDMLGRHVQTLYDGPLATGTSETLTLDGSGLPAGIYVIRATGEDFTKTRRVTVVR